MVVVGIAVFLLLFGDAIPQLRDNVTQEVDMENPEGMNVCHSSILTLYQPCMLMCLRSLVNYGITG